MWSIRHAYAAPADGAREELARLYSEEGTVEEAFLKDRSYPEEYDSLILRTTRHRNGAVLGKSPGVAAL